MTLPQKNGHGIKTPSSKLTILVSSCWEKNFIRNNAHNFFILSLVFLKLLIVSVAFFLGHPVLFHNGFFLCMTAADWHKCIIRLQLFEILWNKKWIIHSTCTYHGNATNFRKKLLHTSELNHSYISQRMNKILRYLDHYQHPVGLARIWLFLTWQKSMWNLQKLRALSKLISFSMHW